MLVREAKREDAPAIARFIVMAEAEVVRWFTGTDDAEASVKMMETLVLAPEPNRHSLHNNLVAEIDGVPAGSVMAFPADSQPELDKAVLELMRKNGNEVKELFFEGEPRTWYLSTMGVDPAFRGKGVGTALMAAAERKGAELGFDKVTLLVSKDKERAKALYERRGYEVLREVEMNGERYFRMGRSLR